MHPLGLMISTNLVLHFHVVSSMEWFSNTIKTISKIYNFVSIEDVKSYFYNQKNYNNCCLITFDDGDKTFYENAFPVLRKLNIPATLFVSPKIIDEGFNYWFQELDYLIKNLDVVNIKETICEIINCDIEKIKYTMLYSIFKCIKIADIYKVIDATKCKYKININRRYNLTNEQLMEINDSELVAIGAHTVNHPILSNETDENAEREITESIEELAKILDKDVKYFAYPNGISGLDYGSREQLILQKNKIELTFTTNKGFFNRNARPLEIPRTGLGGLSKENNAWILSRLSLLPVWDRTRDFIKQGNAETKEKAEREYIKCSIF